MIVKVCGVTNQEDATAAIEGGATAIGFNFYPKSPRFVHPNAAASIITAPGVRRAGVFVNETPQHVEEVARIARLDVAQLHGDEQPAEYPSSVAVWKAFRIGADFDWGGFDAETAEALLFDGPAGDAYGGGGKVFDWRRARGLSRRIILAGGLDASNVAEAVNAALPWGVDACSRIESHPGKKDHRKMLEFLQAARRALQS